ncbi:NAD+ synthase [Emcibacter sp.]|uniref:NAD+ synthase n=1 Tax=Emcibacter sp. TaxID=1979954 RepID=UPI003A8F4E73
MTNSLKIALATLNPTVGDLEGNARKIIEARDRAAAGGADIVVYSELILLGYPPEDLVLKPVFQRQSMAKVKELAKITADGGPAMLIGCCWTADGDKPEEQKLYNAALLLEGGKVAAIRYKHDLPNYGVFDEMRIFDEGPLQGPINFRGVKLGIVICEDMWYPDVTECLTETGAEILVVTNASPYERGKYNERLQLALKRVQESELPLIYVNQVGGQDELVFDGGTFVLNRDYELAVQVESWIEDLTITDWTRTPSGWVCEKGDIRKAGNGSAAMYQAMMLGLRDYVEKNRFPGVILGMSGGIDSALSAAVAVDALGADRVHLVMMPSKYTSQESLLDAAQCAEMMGARIDSIPIVPAVNAFDDMLAGQFAGTEPDITEENIQSRFRGMLLMAISNKFGYMVLTTGNKSEMSVGYATLYGDMCGGYSVLKDIYKTDVFKLCQWRNEEHPVGGLGPDGQVIPENIISKPPTAELRPDQKDEDSLPPYDILDDILECLIEKELAFKEIVARGHDAETVARIEHLLYVAEYKRRQSPPGVKITRRNFGRDRRYPITHGYRNARLQDLDA